ncbi:Sex peptide receptor [Amphibalanus amphitrite]|uniref:Sex peptide receptor n=1 Tax=Amphibalanus amphitrite TaxID=1232801 RepID=A0A6A4VEZ3_AMPAM|nr:Sex peptide receptor [Amphibalanus amphitrite]
MSMNADTRSQARQLYLETMLRGLNLTFSDWEAFQNGSTAAVTGSTPVMFSDRTEATSDICGEGVRWLRDSYRPVHGYLALVVCLFGSVTNLINIVVLTRKGMLSSTNTILTGLAAADLAVMLEYIPFAVQHYISDTDPQSHSQVLYVLFHAHFAQIFHTVSIFMTVMLAVWRFLSIVHPTVAAKHCTYEAIQPTLQPGEYIYSIDISDIARRHNRLLNRANFWLFAVVIKLVPCLTLTYFSVRLIRVLLETKRRKQRLMSGCSQLSADHHLVQDTRRADRTTRMLVAVLLLFLITEFPQGILALLSGVLQERFFSICYQHVGELLDILALTNSAVNFLLYCLMSKQFREAFSALLRRPAHLRPLSRSGQPAKFHSIPMTVLNTNTTFV